MVAQFAWINAVKTGTVTTSTSTEPALPVTNLQTDIGSTSTAWQTTVGVVTGTFQVSMVTQPTTIGIVGIFRTNLSSAATATLTMYRLPTTVVGTVGPLAHTNGQIVFLFADLAVDYFTVAITDTVANPDNHLNIPLAFAGPVWRTLGGLSWQSAMGRDDTTDLVTTRGGQEYIDMRSTAKRWEVAIDVVRDTEVYAQLDRLDRAARLGGNVLLIPTTTSSAANIQNEAIFGVLRATGDIAYPFSTDKRRSWRARLTERL